MKKQKTGNLVYSSARGRCCPGCGHPLKQCACARDACCPPGDGMVRVSRQTKGRKGSGVSLISGLPLGEEELKTLARRFRKRCGSGGCVKNGVIEIQGDHRQALVDDLIEMGYKAKIAGG